MDFQTFEGKFNNPNEPEDIEKWHDNMLWHAALRGLESVKNTLRELKTVGLLAYNQENKVNEPIAKKATDYYNKVRERN